MWGESELEVPLWGPCLCTCAQQPMVAGELRACTGATPGQRPCGRLGSRNPSDGSPGVQASCP